MASAKVRSIVLTGSAAAITVVGAWYGSELHDTRNAAKVGRFSSSLRDFVDLQNTNAIGL